MGAANELSTLTAYHRLIARTRNQQLVNLLNAVIKDERRHPSEKDETAMPRRAKSGSTGTQIEYATRSVNVAVVMQASTRLLDRTSVCPLPSALCPS